MLVYVGSADSNASITVRSESQVEEIVKNIPTNIIQMQK